MLKKYKRNFYISNNVRTVLPTLCVRRLDALLLCIPRGRAVGQLASLISWRSWVRIPPTEPRISISYYCSFLYKDA